MKKIKTILTIGIITSLLFISSEVNAIQLSTSNAKTVVGQQSAFKKTVNFGKQVNSERKEELRKLKNGKKTFIKSTRGQIGKNIKDFRDDYKKELRGSFKKLNKLSKIDLKAKKQAFFKTRAELREKMKNKKLPFAQRADYIKRMRELRAKRFEELKEKLKNNPEALELIQKRKTIFEENKGLREQISSKRKAFREKRAELIIKYRTLVIKKIGDRLDKLSKEKLENLSKKIDIIYKRYENNKKLSQSQKERILAVLEGLKDAISDKLQMLEGDSDDFIDEILSEVE